ncbi:MAG: 3-oxoacyl-[acyl-carrier protein] reductase [Candidatus Poriferisodalaceae bacterium]|jgi:3-oxoacyl-[acyl-carrier protein] reductase
MTSAVPDRFVGKVAVVTGAAKGFGEAIARRLAAEGASVVVADVDVAAGEAVAAAISADGNVASFVECDVSQAEEVEAMMAAAVERYGRLDVLCNNAGLSHRAVNVTKLPEDEFDRMVAINMKSVWLGVKFAAPIMRAQGSGVVVNTASIGAVAPRPGTTVYNACKAAVANMTQGMALELAPIIRVNAVNPVAADTAFMAGAMGVEGGLSDEQKAPIVAGIPMKRMTEPSDVAAAVSYLASSDAEFITGVCLNVDGGRSIS